MKAPTFDLDAVLSRLLTQLYELLAALPMLVVALLIVVLGWSLGGWIARRALLDRVSRRNPLLNDVARTTTRWVVFAVAVLLALELMDATAMVGALLGTAGVVGIAIGFAFKDTLENYLAGLLMSFRRPFAPKDDVVIDGHAGSVIALTSRATVLMTPDGNHLRLPNALVFRSVILNYTRNPTRRFEFDVGIGVQEDLLLAQSLGVEELNALEGVIDKPAPRAFIVSLGDSSVQVRYLGWVDQRHHDYWLVRSEAIRRVKTALEAADMDLPEPTYRLHLSGGALTGGVAVAGGEAMASVVSPAAQGRASASAGNAGPSKSVAPADTRALRELDAQIERDVQQREGANLLEHQAPME
jgi:small-conductance mechanosensitive channel